MADSSRGVNVQKLNGKGFKALLQASAREASFDSVHAFAQCHPETRVSILRKIKTWIDAPVSPEELLLLWLTGAAGAGKSSIAATICEELQREGRLGGNFFFSQQSGCTDAQRLFPTIACQLSEILPGMRELVEDVVHRDPSIVTQPVGIQLAELIIRPLTQLKPLDKPLIIVVDGLDECKGEEVQCQIISLLASVRKQLSFHLRFLVASRPESWIKATFSGVDCAPLTYKVSLHHTHESDADIRLFLKSNFVKLRDAMIDVPADWPSPEVYDALVERAGGMFIYPATVIRFLDQSDISPMERLNSILSDARGTSTIPAGPLAHLDQLYTSVLSTCPNTHQTIPIVLAFLIMLESRICKREVIDVLEELLHLGQGTGYQALRTLHSLLYIPDSIATTRDDLQIDQYRIALEGEAPRNYHKSFRDFLFDPERSHEFYINPEIVHSHLAAACVRMLMNFKFLPKSRLSWLTWSYSLKSWGSHCAASGVLTPGLRTALEQFDPILCSIPQCKSVRQHPDLKEHIDTRTNNSSSGILRAMGSSGNAKQFIYPDPKDVIQAYCLQIIVHLGQNALDLGRVARVAATWFDSQKDCPTHLEGDLNLLSKFGVLDYASQFAMFKEYVQELSPECWGFSSPTARTPSPMPPQNATTVDAWCFLEEGLEYLMTKSQHGISCSKSMSIYSVVFNYIAPKDMRKHRMNNTQGHGGRPSRLSQPNKGGIGLGGSPTSRSPTSQSPPEPPKDMGSDLYDKIKSYFVTLMNAILGKMCLLQDGELLRVYAREWSCFGSGATRINKLFAYLHRYYVSPARQAGRTDRYPVDVLALLEWKTALLRSNNGLQLSVTEVLLAVVQSHRDGNTIDHDVFKQVIASLVSLGPNPINLNPTLDVYQDHFEVPFMDATKQFYHRESAVYLSSDSFDVSIYLKKVDEWFAREEDIMKCLHTTTRGRLIAVCEDILIVQNLELLCEHLAKLYNGGGEENLQQTCRLLLRAPGGLEALYRRLDDDVKGKQAVLLAISESEVMDAVRARASSAAN